MIQALINENIRQFLKALPPNMMSIILFDQENRFIGFAVLDRNDKTKQAEIYDVNCKKIKEFLPKTTIKEAIDFITKEKCIYIS